MTLIVNDGSENTEAPKSGLPRPANLDELSAMWADKVPTVDELNAAVIAVLVNIIETLTLAQHYARVGLLDESHYEMTKAITLDVLTAIGAGLGVDLTGIFNVGGEG